MLSIFDLYTFFRKIWQINREGALNMLILLVGSIGMGKGEILSRAAERPVEQVYMHSRHENRERVWSFSSYYTEDFEDGTADGWELIDGNGDSVTFRVTPCDSIHQPPTSCGAFALNYDDDDAGGSSPPAKEMAVSPSMELPGNYSTLLLRYDYGFDSYDEDDTVRVYLLTVASDSTVDTVLLNEIHLTQTNDSGTVYYDLTPHLNNAVAVKVAFEYVDGGGWNWNVAFDNVSIGIPVPSVLFQEDFEDGSADGWDLVDGNGDSVTFAVTACSDINQPPTSCGQYALNYDDDAAGGSSPPANEMAITPTIHIPSGVSSVIVAYDYGFESYEQDDTVRVSAILHDTSGAVDTILLHEVALGDAESGRFITSVRTEGVDSMRLMFHYVDAGGWNWNAAFDNVAVMYAENDLAITDILLPDIPLYTFYPPSMAPSWPTTGNISVLVANVGVNAVAGVDVTMTLNGAQYASSIDTLHSGEVDTITFADLSIDSLIEVSATHNFILDEYPDNNTIARVVDYTKMYRIATDTLMYADTLVATDAVGSLGDLGPSRIAIRFDSSDLYLYQGRYIKKIFFYHCLPGASCTGGGENAVALYPEVNGQPDHMNPIFRKVIGEMDTVPGLVVVDLDSLPASDTAKLRIGYTYPFYVAREIASLSGGFPFATDDGPCWSGRGCWIQSDTLGPDWHLLTDFGPDMSNNWVMGIILGDGLVGDGEYIVLPGDVKLIGAVKDGYVLLNGPAPRDMRIDIYNTAGRLVRSLIIPEGRRKAFVGNLPSGAYFYLTDDRKTGSLIVR